MPTKRRSALAALLIASAAGPALAADCHMTVLGAPVVDGACAVTKGRGAISILVEGGGTILVRRSILSARLPGAEPRRRRPRAVSYGQVVASGDSDDKTCYFNQRATLCVED